VIFLASLTILNKETCLSTFSGWGVDRVVALHPKEWCRLPPTYFWTTWHQPWAFLVSVKNKKWFFWLVWQFCIRRRVCPDSVDGGLIAWLHSTLRNDADYRLPTFGPHGTNLGHSWFHWIIKSDFSGWFDNTKKGDVSGQIKWMGGWSRGCTPLLECCRLQSTYFWTTWHQTRAFFISLNNKKWFFWLFWQY